MGEMIRRSYRKSLGVGLREILAVSVAVAVCTWGSAVLGEDSCVTCHAALPDALGAPVEAEKAGVHAAAGITCADCHGGDPTDEGPTAMEPEKGFVGKPSHAGTPKFCGRCHSNRAYMRQRKPELSTDQEDTYYTSVHGKRLRQGDERVAVCTSCHGIHGILPVSNAKSPVYPLNVARTCARCHADPAYMAPYKIPTNQFAQYQQSVHAEILFGRRDLSAPTCNDCHGNHGAYPPGATSVAAVCGQCHAVNMDLFVASPHKKAFDQLGLPECVTCHGNHSIQRTSDEMAGTSGVAVCITCHTEGSTGYKGAAEIGKTLSELASLLSEAKQQVSLAERAGMETLDARYLLQEANEALVQSRNLVHSSDPEQVKKAAAEGQKKAATALEDATTAIEEVSKRKRMLAIPLSLIGLLILLLYLKLRQIEGAQRGLAS